MAASVTEEKDAEAEKRWMVQLVVESLEAKEKSYGVRWVRL